MDRLLKELQQFRDTARKGQAPEGDLPRNPAVKRREAAPRPIVESPIRRINANRLYFNQYSPAATLRSCQACSLFQDYFAGHEANADA